jgi:serine/threonine protein kinase
MTDHARGTLFISYSHTERAHMLLLRKHLEGLLYGKGKVWSDEAIPRGSKWETSLRGQLKNSDAALVLVTPDYLASTWCRRELTIISDEQKAGRLKKVFWIQVEPSCWRGSELASFQSWEFNLSEALTAIADVNTRRRVIVKICEDIALEMDAVCSQLDSDLVFVREILADHCIEKGLVVDSALPAGKGAVATVCRGRKGSEDVAINVLRGSQITKLSATFDDMVSARMKLTNQCFIRVLDHFPVTSGHDQFAVVVEEFIGSDVLRLDKFLEETKNRKKALHIDDVATVVRRAVEALHQFHDCEAGTAYGLLTPKHVYYDKRGHKLRLPAVGVSNFLWSAMGWERLATWQDEAPNLAAYVAPEVADGQTATAQTDQYMLGQLAFEMLEGRLPFVIRRAAEVQHKAAFWDDPEATASGEWKHAHRAFAKIIFRMLRRDPAQRWATFDELSKRLFSLEDENRALAKRTFEGLEGFRLQDNRVFFESFYAEFFKRSAQATRRKFEHLDDQPQKLMESMLVVLNFRASNEPTSLRSVVDRHRHLAITPIELDDFQAAFIDTLRQKLPRGMAAELKEKIVSAWHDLFGPVVEYFNEELRAAGHRHVATLARPAAAAATASLPAIPAARASVRTRRRARPAQRGRAQSTTEP